MPYISTTSNISISDSNRAILKEKFGKAIELLPGKTESWLMLGFNDNTAMYFSGNGDKPLAFVNVSIFGKASDSAYNNLTAEITKIINETLGISGDCIYVKYEECNHWGWSGRNF